MSLTLTRSDRNMNRILMGTILGLVAAILSLLIADCSMGQRATIEVSVTGKYYVPERTGISIDSDGHISTTTYPEEFHVTAVELEFSQGYDVNTTRDFFSMLTNGQVVAVSGRIGKWTKKMWLPHFVSNE